MMGGVAEYYFDRLPVRCGFLTGLDMIFVMEKLCDIMSHKLLQKDGELDIRYFGSVFRDKNRTLDTDDAFDRLMNDSGTAFHDAIESGFGLLGDASALFEPVWPLRTDNPDDDGNQDAAQLWFEGRSKVDAVSHFLPSFEKSDLDSLETRFLMGMYDQLTYDPYLEETDFQTSLFKSRMIGTFLSTTLIPESVKERGKELLSIVRDPLDSGYYWEGIRREEYILCFLSGTLEYGCDVFANQLLMRWLPACVLLKEEIERLNRVFHFWEGEI